MAGAVVGQAFLSAFLDVVFDRLASPEVANFIRRNKLDHNLLQRLKNTLYVVQAGLNDAELKQIKNSTVTSATPKEASNFFSRFLNIQEREMVAKLEGTFGKLESIFKLKDMLGLKENACDNLSWRSPSTSLEEGSKIYGRDKDKEAILKLLLDDDKNDGCLLHFVEFEVRESFVILWVFRDTPTLKHLSFFDMRCWKVWGPFEWNAFPRLEKIEIVGCPRLRGQLPTHLPSLGSLHIEYCEQLGCCLPSAPVIRKLRIWNSSKVRFQEVPPSLEVLLIEGSNVESMFEAISNSQPNSSNFYSFLGNCLPTSQASRLRENGFFKWDY
ncbi:hypothetical protein VNO77_23438 [Canavalia gladiata]|uniref:Uncharacterized protein n=1 Tax=Canavalia gladiata TaxID=3824 RepID=A0AAN9QFC8_CANGL